MERCIEYIERHIDEELTPEAIAAQEGYSLFHFARVFSLCSGMSLMEYVRRRRLSLAAQELESGARVMDVAMRYGFDTQSGFAKAFRRIYGCSPTNYQTGGRTMEAIIRQRPAFKMAGYGINTDICSEGYTRDVAAWWSHYEGENLESKMYAQLHPPKHGEVGICIPNGGGGRALYLLGVIIENFRDVTPDMLTAEMPAAEYAVFTTDPVDLTTAGAYDDPLAIRVREAWQHIFEVWFPQSGYIFDIRAREFEFYDERCHGRRDSVMEIWVPVRKAEN